MKLKTSYTVNVTVEEATKLLTRFVEKKSGKKVTGVNFVADSGFAFNLLEEEADLDAAAGNTKEQGA
jgi:hypothetical protein